MYGEEPETLINSLFSNIYCSTEKKKSAVFASGQVYFGVSYKPLKKQTYPSCGCQFFDAFPGKLNSLIHSKKTQGTKRHSGCDAD